MKQYAPLSRLVHRYSWLIITWTVITLICSAEHAGFMIYVLAVPCLLYAAIRYLCNLRSPEKRDKYLHFTCIILLSSSFVAGVHIWRHHQARTYADHIVAKLFEYQATHGNLPAKLDDIPELASDGKHPHMLFYSNDKEAPFLLYAATFVPFEAWHYDFKEKLWIYDYD